MTDDEYESHQFRDEFPTGQIADWASIASENPSKKELSRFLGGIGLGAGANPQARIMECGRRRNREKDPHEFYLLCAGKAEADFSVVKSMGGNTVHLGSRSGASTLPALIALDGPEDMVACAQASGKIDMCYA